MLLSVAIIQELKNIHHLTIPQRYLNEACSMFKTMPPPPATSRLAPCAPFPSPPPPKSLLASPSNRSARSVSPKRSQPRTTQSTWSFSKTTSGAIPFNHRYLSPRERGRGFEDGSGNHAPFNPLMLPYAQRYGGSSGVADGRGYHRSSTVATFSSSEKRKSRSLSPRVCTGRSRASGGMSPGESSAAVSRGRRKDMDSPSRGRQVGYISPPRLSLSSSRR